MAPLIRVARAGDIPENEGIVVNVESRTIAVFCKDGAYYAFDDTCPHQGGSLGQGELEDDCVVCPLHEWRFNIKTGESHELPGFSLEIFPVTVKGNELYITI